MLKFILRDYDLAGGDKFDAVIKGFYNAVDGDANKGLSKYVTSIKEVQQEYLEQMAQLTQQRKFVFSVSVGSGISGVDAYG